VLIWSGTNVVKSFAATNGEPGTLLGLNSFLWDGTNDDGSAAAGGIYTVSITAASAGYGTWTNITDDGTNFMAWAPRGVSVNRNTNSPYYGRVFVANATTDPSGSGPGAQVGIIKCNADGSQADEGGFSNGGLSWGSAMYPYDYSPWKIAISADDEVYIDDYSESGVVYGFDQTISTNQILEVLGMYNYPTNLDPYPQLSGVCVTGTGTNKEIWMPDYNPNGSAGILRWEITSSGTVATNDTGVVIVPVTSASPLSAPGSFMQFSSCFQPPNPAWWSCPTLPMPERRRPMPCGPLAAETPICWKPTASQSIRRARCWLSPSGEGAAVRNWTRVF
jgi:hypothetical protein